MNKKGVVNCGNNELGLRDILVFITAFLAGFFVIMTTSLNANSFPKLIHQLIYSLGGAILSIWVVMKIITPTLERKGWIEW